MADDLSGLPALPVEDPPLEVKNVDLLHSPRHWDINKLAAAQQDQPNLEAVCQLAQQKRFQPSKIHLVRQPEAPEITRQMILLPEPYGKQAILALHNNTHAGAKATIQMARSRYFWKGLNKQGHQGNHQDL